MILKTKAKYKYKDKLIPGYLTITKKELSFVSLDQQMKVNIPLYRIVQTGYRRKFFFFNKYFYLKTSDGKPSVFYVARPKECMRKLDRLVYFKD